MKFFAFITTLVFAVILAMYLFMQSYSSMRLDQLRNSLNVVDQSQPDFAKFLSWHEKYLYERKLDDYIGKLTLEEQIGQILLVSAQEADFADKNKDLLARISPGGIYLGYGKVTTLTRTKELVENLQKNSKIKLIMSTDNEGYPIGRIFWGAGNGLIATQGQSFLGINNTYDVSKGYGETNAKELLSAGLNMNMSPVADIRSGGSYLYSRTFSGDLDIVDNLSGAIIDGQKAGGIFSALKYFPGTGRSGKDPKNQILDINISKDELFSSDLKPFIENANKSEFIITSHSKFPKIDSEIVTFSKVFVQDILKEELKFGGIVLTDDMNVPSLEKVENKYVKALVAGHDMIWIDGDMTKIQEAQTQIKTALDNGSLDKSIFDKAVRKVIQFKMEEGWL